jgi:malate permease and related proteins
MQVVATIIPIFFVIFLGWVARKRSFITPEFLGPANRLVYFLSMPALIFSSIAKASFNEQFDALVLFLTLSAAVLLYAGAHLFAGIARMAPARAGAFVQSSGHGNLGYIGLPIALYYLGESGLAKAGIICGFLMILQNLLSVISLQLYDRTNKKAPGLKAIVKKIVGNPVIIGAMAGILVSALEISLPMVIRQSIDILGGLAPPMALLLIGASLSMQLIRTYLVPSLIAVTFKLIVLPAAGLLLFSLFHVPAASYLPALILLCSPTATIAYVMAKEMHGDADFTVATISAGTLFSAITFIVWLTLVSLYGMPS